MSEHEHFVGSTESSCQLEIIYSVFQFVRSWSDIEISNPPSSGLHRFKDIVQEIASWDGLCQRSDVYDSGGSTGGGRNSSIAQFALRELTQRFADGRTETAANQLLFLSLAVTVLSVLTAAGEDYGHYLTAQIRGTPDSRPICARVVRRCLRSNIAPRAKSRRHLSKID